MAPRQRISPRPSMEDLSSSGDSSTTSLQQQTQQQQQQQERSPLVQNHDEMKPRAGGDDAMAAAATAAMAIEAAAQMEAADRAREHHDFFNIITLVLVVAASAINWDFTKLMQGPQEAYIGNYFYLSWATTILYFIVDLIWVASVPICVKSPGVIIKHHFVAIVYLSGPLIFRQYEWFMGACLSVEINTWFLILRRVVYKRQDTIPAILIQLVTVCFYVSWIIIRIFLYPAIFIIFCQMAVDVVETTGTWKHPEMSFIPVHFFLCVLNLKWSYDLFKPFFLRMDQKVSEGL